MKTGKILVVGGYGSVGKTISIALTKDFPGRVIAAGRSIQKAQKFTEETTGAILPLELDIFAPDAHLSIPADVSTIVMCLDQDDTHFVEAVLNMGLYYVDISANTSFLRQLEKLDAQASESHSTVLLSVGLAPGLSNLLAAKAHKQLGDTIRLDIYILLGLGELHGEAAIRWTLDNLNTNFQITENGSTRTVQTLGDGKTTIFPGIGKRSAYRFNFPDQHTLSRTLSIPSVATWLSFDVDWMMRIFAALKKFGLLKIFQISAVQSGYIWLTQRIQYGSEVFAIQAHVSSDKGKSLRLTLQGENEARMTALVAAQVVKQLLTSAFPAGVFHIDQLFEVTPFIESLREHGLRINEE